MYSEFFFRTDTKVQNETTPASSLAKCQAQEQSTRESPNPNSSLRSAQRELTVGKELTLSRTREILVQTTLRALHYRGESSSDSSSSHRNIDPDVSCRNKSVLWANANAKSKKKYTSTFAVKLYYTFLQQIVPSQGQIFWGHQLSGWFKVNWKKFNFFSE